MSKEKTNQCYTGEFKQLANDAHFFHLRDYTALFKKHDGVSGAIFVLHWAKCAAYPILCVAYFMRVAQNRNAEKFAIQKKNRR